MQEAEETGQQANSSGQRDDDDGHCVRIVSGSTAICSHCAGVCVCE